MPTGSQHQSIQSRISNHPLPVPVNNPLPVSLNPVRPARKVKLRSSDTTPADSADESESSSAYPARLRVLKTGSNTPIDLSADEGSTGSRTVVPLPKLVKKSRQNTTIEMNRSANVNKQSPISTVSTVSTVNEEIVNKQLAGSASADRKSAASVIVVEEEEEIPSNQRQNKNVNKPEVGEEAEIPSNQNNQQKDQEDQSKWSRSNSYANAVDI